MRQENSGLDQTHGKNRRGEGWSSVECGEEVTASGGQLRRRLCKEINSVLYVSCEVPIHSHLTLSKQEPNPSRLSGGTLGTGASEAGEHEITKEERRNQGAIRNETESRRGASSSKVPVPAQSPASSPSRQTVRSQPSVSVRSPALWRPR